MTVTGSGTAGSKYIRTDWPDEIGQEAGTTLQRKDYEDKEDDGL